MISYNPLRPLHSAILEILAERKDISFEELHDQLTAKYAITVSTQNLYRTVGILIEHQVLVRSGCKLSLHHVWVKLMIEFGKKLENNYHLGEGSRKYNLPSKEGETRVYAANSLFSLDPIWNDGLLKLAQVASAHDWYVYNSHPWYSIGMPDTEYRLYRSIVDAGISCHMLYGNNRFLDHYGRIALDVPGFKTAILEDRSALSSDFKEEGHAVWVCGDFIVECIMPAAISSHFGFLFKTIEKKEDINHHLFSDIFRMKARCKIAFSLYPQLAARYREILIPCFKEKQATTPSFALAGRPQSYRLQG